MVIQNLKVKLFYSLIKSYVQCKPRYRLRMDKTSVNLEGTMILHFLKALMPLFVGPKQIHTSRHVDGLEVLLRVLTGIALEVIPRILIGTTRLEVI